MTHKLEPTPMKAFLDHRKRFIVIDDTEQYKRVTVKLHAQGVVLRDYVYGSQLRTKKQQATKADDLLVAEIDAKVGGVGIVPPELAGAIVSSHYFLYEVDDSVCHPKFLDYYIRSGAVERQFQQFVQGSTNYAAVRLYHTLELQIPLPPLDEQRRIVARVEELAALINEAQALRAKAREEAEALLRSALQCIFATKFGSPDDWPTLSSVVEYIENGWSPACPPYPVEEEGWGVLKVGAVSTGQFVPGENKVLLPHLEPRPELEIRDGDFLFGRANTKELVGACAVVHNPPKHLMLCDKIFRFLFRPNAQVDKLYLNFVLKSPPLREQIEAVASGTSSSMKNISKAKTMQLRLPLPSLSEQRQIVAYLNPLQSQMDELTTLQDATQVELDALLPSVLDRAFKGEL